MKTIETKYTCDKCGGQLPLAATTKICVGRVMNASGNGYDSDMRDVDLCANCLHDVVCTAWEAGTTFRSLPN